MNVFVLDASVASSWVFPDEFDPIAENARIALRDGDTALTPAIWWYELRNTLVVGERRLRLNIHASEQFLAALGSFDIRVHPLPANAEPLFELARRHKLSFYDAAYLALAIAEGAPLATLDKALAKAAEREGVELLAP